MGADNVLIQEIWDEVDENKDGVITIDEFLKGVQNLFSNNWK